MLSVNHVVTGAATCITIDTVCRIAEITFKWDGYGQLCNFMHSDYVLNISSNMLHYLAAVVTIAINIALFILGCLLPDCDQKNSVVGKIIHIPVKHRTWTHTIWCVILLAVMGFSVHSFFWLAYGYFAHIFYDSLSRAGICWFYPLSQYQIWPSGAQVKINHKLYLYRTGRQSETVITTIVALLGIVSFFLSIYLTIKGSCAPFHANELFEFHQV